MKERIESLIAELGCETDDLGLVLWNTPPGAVVLIEKLLARIRAMEQIIDAVTPRPKVQARPVDVPRIAEKVDVPASA